MSETRGKYTVKRKAGTLPPGTLLRYTDPGYEPPSAEDVRLLKEISGYTGRELCELVGVDDHRTWRRWSQDADQPGARKIPYSAWHLLLRELGLVKLTKVGLKNS